MAKEYFDKLSSILNELNIKSEVSLVIEIKHFFNGAALYANKAICVSWSPVGLAFKLAEKDADKLINSGEAKALKYFPRGHIKKGYALFEDPDDKRASHWKKYFIKAISQV